MNKTIPMGGMRVLCGGALIAASAGCTAREPVPDTRRLNNANGVAAEPLGAAPTVAPRAPPPAAPPPAKEAAAKPGAPPRPPPPVRPTPAPPRDIKPSPWQPPAVIDPVRPEVGNETPG